jgi:hypothetical protein
MAHHGWIPVDDPRTLAPSGLKSPFGRLFEASSLKYDSLAISLLAGARGPMVEPAATADKLPNAAGFTFLGQFIDHDVTEFRVIGEDNHLQLENPVLGQRQRVLEDGEPTTTNGRLARLDLDSVYGLLGVAQMDLFDGRGLFILEVSPGGAVDIKRAADVNNSRLIADPRNDENKLVVQVHLLFERLHNMLHERAIAADGAADPRAGGTLFRQTQSTVRRIYRRIVFHDYLPRIVQTRHIRAVLDAMSGGRTFFDRMTIRAAAAYRAHFPELGDAPPPITEAGGAVPGTAVGEGDRLLAMPVEFAHAVFRLGHSQLREAYNLNAAKSGPNAIPLFRGEGDLRGKARLFAAGEAGATPGFIVDWELFFGNVPGKNGRFEPRQPGRPIDASLPGSVFQLPRPAIGEPPTSLAERNIRRGVDFGLPSGQKAASYLTSVYGPITGLTGDQLFPATGFAGLYSDIKELAPQVSWDTPLWYYILCEAALHDQGPQLGDVGGLIVAETLLGLLTACDGEDGFSFAEEEAKWRAAYPADDVEHLETDTSLKQPIGDPEAIDSMASLLTAIGAW